MSPSAAPARADRPWLRSLALAPAFVLVGLALAGGRPTAATQAAAEPEPTPYVKIGKNYIKVDQVIHAIDDPGGNLPPGAIQLYFNAGQQYWVNLYGDEAAAFRQAIDKMATDLTPKAGEASKKAAAGTKKAVTATRKPAAPAPAAPAPVSDPGSN